MFPCCPPLLRYTQYTQYTTTENRRRGRRGNPPGMAAGGGGGGEMRMEGNDPYYRARCGESRDPRKGKEKKHSPLPKRKKSPQYIHMYVCVDVCRHARDIKIRSLPFFPRPRLSSLALVCCVCVNTHMYNCRYTHPLMQPSGGGGGGFFQKRCLIQCLCSHLAVFFSFSLLPKEIGRRRRIYVHFTQT